MEKNMTFDGTWRLMKRWARAFARAEFKLTSSHVSIVLFLDLSFLIYLTRCILYVLEVVFSMDVDLGITC